MLYVPCCRLVIPLPIRAVVGAFSTYLPQSHPLGNPGDAKVLDYILLEKLAKVCTVEGHSTFSLPRLERTSPPGVVVVRNHGDPLGAPIWESWKR